MKILDFLNNAPKSKKEVRDYSEKLLEYILNGENDLLDVKIRLKGLYDMIKAIESNEQFKDALITEAENYGEKEFVISDNKIAIRNKPVFDFSVCQDTEYNEIKTSLEMRKNELKQRETFLKNLKGEYVNMNTGEIIYPPMKKTTTYLVVTLKKE